MAKLISIKDDKGNEEFVETIRTRRIYKLSELINVDANSTTLPSLFNDIDENSELCGVLNEIPMAKFIQCATALEQKREAFKQLVVQFSANTKEIENECVAIIAPLLNEAKALRPDLVMEIENVEFKDQNGEAKIASRLSVSLDKKEKRIVPALEHNNVEVEVLGG